MERATGRVLCDQGATRSETTVFTEGATYARPTWARWIEATCIGGGGGASGVSEARWWSTCLAAR